MKKISIVMIMFIIAMGTAATIAMGADPCVVITAPALNSTVISKVPEIKAEYRCPIKPESLVVIFDGIDVTQILDSTDKGFTYQPGTLTAAGNHALKIVYSGEDGIQQTLDLPFVTRHSEAFNELYSKNDTTLIYTGTLARKDTAADAAVPFNTGTQVIAPSSTSAIPTSKLEGNLASENKLKEGNWATTLTTNVRYLEQDTAVMDPLKKGFTVANWLFTGDYEREGAKMKLSSGDVTINETPYTIAGFSRKGTTFSGEAGPLYANAFSARSMQTYGVDGGIGIGSATEDHVIGASGGFRLFDKKVDLRTIYVIGTDSSMVGLPSTTTPATAVPNVYGTSGIAGKRQGDVLGFLLTTDLIENRLRTEMEADFSRFDPDTSDEFEKNSSAAYRGKIGGTIDWFTYEALYEYIGKYYGLVANPSMAKDKQGYSFTSGVNLADQNLNIMASRYTDNVEKDPLFAENVATTGSVAWQFRKIPYVPLGFTYTKSKQESDNIPAGQVPVDLQTDTYAGQIGLAVGNLIVTFSPSYTLMDDKTPADADTTNITYTLTAAYTLPNISATPACSWGRSRNHLTDVWSDIYSGSFDLRTKFFSQRASFDIGGTYALAQADNASVNNETWNGRAALSYSFGDYLIKYGIKPTASLRGNYLKITDKVNPTSDKDEFTVLMVLELAVPVFF